MLAIRRRLSQVIKLKANDPQAYDFMAAHKPFRHLKFESNNPFDSSMKIEHEEDIIQQFFQPNYLELHTKSIPVFVLGDNGSGKSHLIRWMYERLIRMNYVTQDAEIYFIPRLNNSLKPFIDQIVESPLFQGIGLDKQLEKISQVDWSLDSESLKSKILFTFARFIEFPPQNVEIPRSITLTLRTSLQQFFTNVGSRDLLLKEGGPISRVQRKIISLSNDDEIDIGDVEFQPRDMLIDRTEIESIREQVNVATRNLLDIFYASDNPSEIFQKKRREICDFLNQLINHVITDVAKFNKDDLYNIFLQLRKSLKTRNKYLVLLIEDINAQRGIDDALVDLIIEDDHETCPIVSFVGCANSYYNGLRDNSRQRIERVLRIDQSFSEETDVIELVAKYLNAIYLSVDDLKKWQDQGFDSDKLPISDMFKEHSWANVKIRHHELTLFPFNQHAVVQLYRNLEKSVPRFFLRDVLQKTLNWMIDSGIEQFPPDTKFFQLGYSFLNPNDQSEIKKINENYRSRIQSLFLIWGDRTAAKTISTEETYFGGVESAIFTSFQIPLPDEVRTGFEVKPPNATPLKPANEDNKQTKFDKFIALVGDWETGNSLSDPHLRDDLLDWVKTGISWSTEGVSTKLVRDWIDPNRVGFEGQASIIRSYEKLLFRRSNPKLKFAFYALGAWRILGNKNWEFFGSEEYMFNLVSWLESERETIVTFVKQPIRVERTDISKDYIIVLAQLMNVAYFGKFQFNQFDLFDVYKLLVNPQFEPRKPNVGTENAKLNSLLAMSTNVRLFFVEYFNCSQFLANEKDRLNVVFLDAESILHELNTLITDSRPITKYIQELFIKDQVEMSFYILSMFIRKLLSDDIQKIFKENWTHIDSMGNKILEYLGDVKRLEQTVKALKEMWHKTQGKVKSDLVKYRWIFGEECQVSSLESDFHNIQAVKVEKLPLIQLLKCNALQIQQLEKLLSAFDDAYDNCLRDIYNRYSKNQTVVDAEQTKKAIEKVFIDIKNL